MTNLLKPEWETINSAELLILCRERISFGQFDSTGPKDRVYFPLARKACEFSIKIDDDQVLEINPGDSFDAKKWSEFAGYIDKALFSDIRKIGRDFSFVGHRVAGFWRGARSGIQIVPPPPAAPRAPVEMAEHPFILEFPITASESWSITNRRRLVEHRKLSLLLNALLRSRVSMQSHRLSFFWAATASNQSMCSKIKRCAAKIFRRPVQGEHFTSTWTQQSFFADFGPPVADELSNVDGDLLEEIDSKQYYNVVHGIDGRGLRIPSDLDDSICRYTALSSPLREKFDRAAFWLDIAARQWTTSTSASFAAVVSAVEALTEGRGEVHEYDCPVCGKPTTHEVRGATRRFIDFFDTHAPDVEISRGRRSDIYALRSGIVHGSKLMEIDRELAIGTMSPADFGQHDLTQEFWSLTNAAVRNWLRSFST
jgi:hypothetical protein